MIASSRRIPLRTRSNGTGAALATAACALSLQLGACGAAGESLRAELRSGNAVPNRGHVPVADPELRTPSRVGLTLRHRIELASPTSGAYVPLERASIALDAERGRIYVGTSAGKFHAFGADGQRLYTRNLGASVDAAPVVDTARDTVYVASSDGKIRSFVGPQGEPALSAEVGHPFVATPLLVGRTLYCIAETDVLVAVSTEDGAVLWTYRRPPAEELTITGHAGLTLHEGKLLTAFNDGVVVGIDAGDGSVLWEIDTSVDLPTTASGLPRMRDVDTTPVVLGGSLFVASFAAGLYELDVRNGTVLNRDEDWTGVTNLLGLPSGDLFIASADRGYARLRVEGREAVFTRAIERGAPSGLAYVSGLEAVVLSETAGSLIAIRADDGHEVGRFESGYGFGSSATVAGDVIGILSNSASVMLLETR